MANRWGNSGRLSFWESPLDYKEIQPIHPKGNQSWTFIRRTDVEAVTPILCPPNAKNWLTGKDPDAGKDWRKEEKGMTKDEMVGWYHQLKGHVFAYTPGVNDGQGGLVCCSPWSHKESDTTEQLNWNELSQAYGFSSSHVWMWELEYKESWVLMNWCFWTLVLEKTLESPLDCKEIQQVHPKGDQSWIFTGRTDAEAETPILWPPDAKSWLIWKDPDAGKDWRQEEKGMTEDEMVGRLHWLLDMSLGKLQKFMMDREACRAVIHSVAKSQTRLSDWTDWRFKNIKCDYKDINY